MHNLSSTFFPLLFLSLTLDPSHAHQHPFSATFLNDLDDVDIASGSAFNGLTTFANIPYANCFVEDESTKDLKYDIAFLGAGFDTVSWFLLSTFRKFLRGWLWG